MAHTRARALQAAPAMGRISADRMAEMFGDTYYGEGRRGGAERRRAGLSPSKEGEVGGGRRTRARASALLRCCTRL